MKRNKIIKDLKKLKEEHPNQEIIIETPHTTIFLQIGDAEVYEGMNGEIVIDNE